MNVNKELKYMKYLFNYEKGVVISEQKAKNLILEGSDPFGTGGVKCKDGTPEPGFDKKQDSDGKWWKKATGGGGGSTTTTTTTGATTRFTSISNWEDLVKYFSANTDSNWEFVEKVDATDNNTIYERLKIKSKKPTDLDCEIYFWNDGDSKKVNCGKSINIYGEWGWESNKPKLKFEKVTKNATGYVDSSDTDWKSVTENSELVGVGSKGPLVKKIQHYLVTNGYSGTTGPITTDVEGCKTDEAKCDGEYGKNTKEAVEKFQKDEELHIDGIVGIQTYHAMFGD